MTTTPEEIEQLVFGTLTELAMLETPVTRDTVLIEIGIDSPDLVEVQDALERRLGLRLESDALETATTAGDVVERAVAASDERRASESATDVAARRAGFKNGGHRDD